jgi:hypothetical protein
LHCLQLKLTALKKILFETWFDRGLGCILALVEFVEVVDLVEDSIAFLFRFLRGFGLRCLCFLPLVLPCFSEIVDLQTSVLELIHGCTFWHFQVSLRLWYRYLLGPLLSILRVVALCFSKSRSTWLVPELPASVGAPEPILESLPLFRGHFGWLCTKHIVIEIVCEGLHLLQLP